MNVILLKTFDMVRNLFLLSVKLTEAKMHLEINSLASTSASQDFIVTNCLQSCGNLYE